MPKPVVIPNPQLQQDWLLIRQGLKRCIEAVAPNARIYDRWPLKFDPGQTAELLKSPIENRIHSWIIGINAADTEEDRVGGGVIFYNLNIRIWGFIGYEYGIDSDNPQNTIETEARKITQVIYANREHLTLDFTQSLHEVGLLTFRDIDAQGFGRDDVIIAQGELRIKIREVL